MWPPGQVMAGPADWGCTAIRPGPLVAEATKQAVGVCDTYVDARSAKP
jgi:hypothetical protein